MNTEGTQPYITCRILCMLNDSGKTKNGIVKAYRKKVIFNGAWKNSLLGNEEHSRNDEYMKNLRGGLLL